MTRKRKERMVVAMSGGVDSSTAAALLKEEGYEVIGLTMRLWDTPQEETQSSGCCSPEDIRDARRVADQIGIPHYVINLKKAFEEEVVQNFIDEYLAGRTPNPCIHCNDRIKFGFLLRKAAELEARALATGHYARILPAPPRSTGGDRLLLLRGKHRAKDQSYFLFTLRQDQMRRIAFPLGALTKSEVRETALRMGLRVADKNESQEVCFIPGNDYRRFLEERKGKDILKPGEIVDRRGKRLGLHKGLPSYTVGQRRGLGIAGPHPYYVLALDGQYNRLIAGTRDDLSAEGFIAGKVNWIPFSEPGEILGAQVQIRYRHPAAEASISPLGGGRVKVEFQIPQKSVTPGQAAVFYRGEEVLGGGWIEKSL